METPAGKAPVPHPRTNLCRGFDTGQTFTGLRGALMRQSHWELCFLHWKEKRWVKLQRSGRKLECIPQWESILGGVYDPGQEASYEGQPRPPAAPRPLQASPKAPLPAQRRISGPPLEPGAPSDHRRYFELSAFIIRS